MISLDFPRDKTAADMLGLISSDRAPSRADLARELGLAASTVSLHVQQLIDAGLVIESDTGRSTGGRRPRVLQLNPGAGHVLAADLGAHHARIGVIDLLGRLGAVEEIVLDVADGPESVLTELAQHLEQQSASGVLRGVAISLPAPTSIEHGWVQSPSRMPGWHHYPVRDRLTAHFGVPCTVENDTNAMAVAEYTSAQGRFRDLVLVKAGAAIGCGIIVDGKVHHGSTGAAGDITHVRVAAAGEHPCSCGNVGCLETIASGAALVRDLRAEGYDVSTTSEVVALARDGDPGATTYIRTAGRHLGETLSTVVNFINPDAVLLTGSLSTLEPFVAAVRSRLYEGCHPLATQHLVIDRAASGADAGLLGVGRQALAQALGGIDPATTPVRRPTPTPEASE